MRQRHIYFMKTKQIGFSKWGQDDLELATVLWGNAEVTRYICASGKFSKDDIEERLNTEILNEKNHRVQYWPVFELATDNLIGCCGLRPYAEKGIRNRFPFATGVLGKGVCKRSSKRRHRVCIHYFKGS